MKFLLKLSSHVTKRDTPNTTFCRHFWSACYSPEAHQTQRQKRSFLIHYVQRQRYSAVSKGKIVRPLERSKKKKNKHLDEPVIDPQLLLHCKHQREHKKEKE